MSATSFRFDPNQLHARVRAVFGPRKPRHRLARFAVGLLGLGVLALLAAVSVMLGAAMIAAGVVYRLWTQRGRKRAASQVVEGEYRVVRQELPRTRRPL